MAVKLNIQFKGLDEVIKNLNAKVREIEGYTRQGVIAAALLVKGEAMRKTPVDTSNLVNSAYAVWSGGKDDAPSFVGKKASQMAAQHEIIREGARASAKQVNQTTAVIGFTAAYAIYVHEIDKNYRKPGSSWKFLELALMENEEKILQILRDSVRKAT